MAIYRVYSEPNGTDQFYVEAPSASDAIRAVRKHLVDTGNAKAFWISNSRQIQGPERFRPADCNTTYQPNTLNI